MIKDMQSRVDITTNVKIIDFLKGEMLTDIAELFKLMTVEDSKIHDTTLDIVANLIIEAYILGKRMGLSYESIDLQIKEKLRVGVDENNDIERVYKDLSGLCTHMSASRRR